MNESLKETLEAREITHGNYEEFCRTWRLLCTTVFKGSGWRKASEAEHFLEESSWATIMMITHKLARISAGDPGFEDHWRDVAGYAEKFRELLEQHNY